MPASQDYRDGAATGAAILAHRLRLIASFGITMTPAMIDDLASAIQNEYGGAVNVNALN